jgi:hypothetical protein
MQVCEGMARGGLQHDLEQAAMKDHGISDDEWETLHNLVDDPRRIQFPI